MQTKSFILILFAIHLIKSILLFQYNKKLNDTVSYSDFLAYLTSGYFTLYIEKAPKSLERNVILTLHYSILVFALALIGYALVLIL